ncbi:MAG: AMP-binding protein [Gammaproteobacteria bacterium]|nr:AMP-binding protein [Gammaproteobacteria bacterium]
MEKVWLKSYPTGIPEFVELERYASLAHMFDDCAERYRHLPAFANMGTSLSFSELNIESYNFAAYLQTELGLRKGEYVAVMLPNILQFPVAVYGILRAGLAAVNINPQYTSRELGEALNGSAAKVIVILENFADVLAEVVMETHVEQVIIARVGDMLGFPKSAVVNFALKHVHRRIPEYTLDRTVTFRQALATGQQRQLVKPELNREDTAFLQLTGGTTGLAKMAVLSHGNLLSNLAQMEAWLRQVLEDGKETVITALPLYHIFSLMVNCFLFTSLGGLNYLITNPRDMKGFVKELRRVRFSVITGVNTLFNGLLNAEGFTALDFSNLKISLGGGMAVQESVAEKWCQVTGCVLTEAYGLTETSPAVTINPFDLGKYNGSIGLPIPNTEISIQDNDGRHLELGEAGELCVRGPQVMQGYLNDPVETRKVLSEDGWLHTGDIAVVDDQGYVRIVDRKKDMILVSGFNVYPNEIENVVAAHDGVLEVAAIGVDDEESGEVVKLCIVKKDPALTATEVLEFCKDRLTRYKWPKHIEFYSELPKSNVGKILRRVLREEASPASQPTSH